MKPLIYSKKEADATKQGWIRDGEKICYYQSNSRKKNNGGYLYALSFSIKFKCKLEHLILR
jgi:hypothetical protein